MSITALAGDAAPFHATPFPRKPSPAELDALGRRLFFEPALSASGRMACASCHSPAHAWGPPPDGSAVRLGGAGLDRPGLRAVPSLTYRQAVPPFTEHGSDSDGNDGEDLGPTGGLDWDGRADSLHAQAEGPLLSPFEMANSSPAQALARLKQSPSAAPFTATFGAGVFDSNAVAWNGLRLALETFLQNPAEFARYDSKYDAVLRGRARFTPAEARGFALFNAPDKGDCARCHPGGIKRGAFPRFTDDGYAALGLPRNRAIPANADPAHHDLGLCGPQRADLRDRREYCGLFRVPTLRNAARRSVFFHNGAIHRLEDAVRFYASRDADPARWYGRDARGRVVAYDDLPAGLRGNVDRTPPFARQSPGRPALTEAEIADIVAFLRTLDDGWKGRDQAGSQSR